MAYQIGEKVTVLVDGKKGRPAHYLRGTYAGQTKRGHAKVKTEGRIRTFSIWGVNRDTGK